MLFTNEYTVLKSQDGGKDIVIKPGKINAFNPIKGKFVATSYARILDVDTHNQVDILDVGEVFDGVGMPPVVKAKK